MLWQGYPVFKYLTFIVLFLFSYLGILHYIEKKLLHSFAHRRTVWYQRVSYAALCSGLIFIGPGEVSVLGSKLGKRLFFGLYVCESISVKWHLYSYSFNKV
jgi:hypothetical protein